MAKAKLQAVLEAASLDAALRPVHTDSDEWMRSMLMA
jgi:hypothetical protein